MLRTLYGLPLADDVRTHRYLLVAADNGGEFAKMAFDVAVAPSAVQRRLSHEFSVLLDVDYQQFLFKVRQPVVQSIATRASIIIIIIILLLLLLLLLIIIIITPGIFTTSGIKNNNNIIIISELGRRICVHTGDAREPSYLFQRISVMLQRFNCVLLHDTLPVDLPDL